MEAPVRIENGHKTRGTLRKKRTGDEGSLFLAMNGIAADMDSAAQLQSSAVAEGVLGAPSDLGLPLDLKGPLGVQANISKFNRMKDCVQQSISDECKKKVSGILHEVHQLSDIEKLLLYLQLPTGAPPSVDPLKQKSPGNPLGKKADMEVAQTYTWIQSHLEEDSEVSLPKQEVYEEYRIFCQANKIEALCAADFGKVMKFVFPSVKPRRLGTRGNSRYCYSGLRKRLVVESPMLPDLTDVPDALQDRALGVGFGSSGGAAGPNPEDEVTMASCCLVFEWAEKLLGKRFAHMQDLACHLVENTYVDTRSVAAFTLRSSCAPTPSTSVQNGQGNTKGNQGNGIVKSIGNTNRRRETQLQLQRKLMEKELIKEQKKKMQEQRSQAPKSNKGLRKNKKDTVLLSNGKTKDESLVDPTGVCLSGNIVKIEEAEDLKEMDILMKSSPQKLLRCQSDNSIPFEMERKAKKVPIVRKSSSPAVSYQQTALPSIIILPGLPQQVQITPSDVGCRSPTKVVAQPKYKRIQPKPATGPTGKPFSALCSPVPTNEALISETAFLSRSFSVSPQSFTTSLSIEQPIITESSNNINGFSTPPSDIKKNDNIPVMEEGITDSKHLNEIVAPYESTKSVGVIVEAPSLLHSKRQSEEPQTGGAVKKLHLEDVPKDMSFPQAVNSEESVWNKMAPSLNSPPMTKLEEAFNLPTCSQAEEKNEMSIHELESDALMEFLQGSNQAQNSNTVIPSASDGSGVNRTARAFKQVGKSSTQLSQLRLLLERNLPHHTANRLIGSLKQPIESSELSELKQVLLRDNRQNFRSKSAPSSGRGLQNWLSEPPPFSSALSDMTTTLDKGNIENLSAVGSPQLENSLQLDESLCCGTSLMSVCQSQPSLDPNQNSLPTGELVQQRPIESTRYSSICTQVPSVPPSPNTRRRAFNFMPISPRQTPNPVDNHLGILSPVPPQFFTSNVPISTTNVVSIAVGPSQPPSAASSPFVSPRSTPVPSVRSRHNSGQSIHRQTPCQTTDSGVSSISTSPFVSPQTTPIPVSRLRHNSNHSGSLGKTVTFSTSGPQVSTPANSSFHCRSRHSSGPLTPSTVSQGFLSRPPMSPLVGENYTQTSFPETPSQRSRHNSASSQPPESPLSNPVSPLALVNADQSGLEAQSVFSLKQSPHVQWSSGSWSTTRSRHVSGSVIHHRPSNPLSSSLLQNVETLPQGSILPISGDSSSLSLEIQSLLQGPTMPIDPSTRSRSVPLHQMLRNMIDQAANPREDTLAVSENFFGVSRSYPATPLNDSPFHLSMGRDAMEDPNLGSLKSHQPDWASLDMLSVPSSRRNLTELLDQPPMDDDLQTTLEDLRDCDNDYSKFALELDQVSQETSFS